MALKVLTGILQPIQTPGNATIHFAPHSVTGDAVGVELNAMGDAGDFAAPPGKVVSLRKITVLDRDQFWGTQIVELFEIRDDPVTIDHMVVRWSTSGGGRIDEISYMIVGEA